MPTYDYACDACKHEFEQFESITAEPQKKCPKCKKNKLRRLFGAGGGLIFKGSGFYQTDYRPDSYKKAAEADKPKSESSGFDLKGLIVNEIGLQNRIETSRHQIDRFLAQEEARQIVIEFR